MGKALKGYRDKVYVATKVVPGTPEAMRKSIDASMAALGLDHVDILQLHDVSSKAGVMDKAYRDVLAEAKQQGKTRFIGITCHKNEADILNALADDPDKFFDVVLVAYNFNSKPGVKEAIARVAKAGMGVIAMKTQAGGYKTKALGDVSPHQAALKFVLQNPNVTAAIPAMVDLKQVKEDLAVMNMKFTQADLDILKRYQQATADVYCHRCGACTSFMPGQPRHRPYQPQLDVCGRVRRSGIGAFDLCGTRARDEGQRMRRLRRMHRPMRERFEHCRTHAAGKGSVRVKGCGMRWSVVVAWFMTCEMAWAAPGAGPLRALMDKSALKEGWTRSGKAEFFDKDTLFDLVDGEAEAYFPYGFKGAVSANYTKGGDKAKEANVELYEMGSLLDAYGIYSTMRDAESKPVDVGAEGFGGTTQVMFYVDKYFVKARVYSAAASGELLSFAKAVAGELPADKRSLPNWRWWQFPTLCRGATNMSDKACWDMRVGLRA